MSRLEGLAALVVLAWLLAPAVSDAQAGPTLALGGDVIYDGALAYQLRHRARDVGRRQAYREVFADLAPTLRRADLALINLETPVAPRYRERGDIPAFHAPADFLDALRDAGVDAVSVANNHAYDQGVRGLRRTLRAAATREIAVAGAGDDAPDAARAVTLRAGRATVAIAAWTEGSNQRPHAEEGARPRVAFLRDGTLEASLRDARQRADLVVAVFHWTQEDEVTPRPVMREAARRAAEAGADLVVGHGTHVPGRTEILRTRDGRRVQVLYSLGNLLASMEEPAGTLGSRDVGVRDAPLALVRTRWREGHLEVASLRVRDHWIARPTPNAPWIASGRLAVSRPVALEAELERIRQARCGELCDARARAYRQREALIRDAMRDIGGDGDRSAVARATEGEARSSDGRDAASSETVASRATGSTSALAIASAVASPHHDDDAAPSAVGAARRRRRHQRTGPQRIADDDPRLRPYLGGLTLAIEFPDGGAREQTVDARAVTRLAALMREDHGLRAEVVASAPSASLARLRARRVKGLIAIHGPSRSRFEIRGRVAARPSVRIRLVR